MKVMLISTYDRHGGAAMATWRLFKSLEKRKGVEVAMYVQKKESNEKIKEGKESRKIKNS